MKLRWLVGVVVVVALVVAVTLLLLPSSSPWTTGVPEALAELEEGLEAQQKLYYDEAAAHFERALELDPDFAAAKLLLHSLVSMEASEVAEGLESELERVDPQLLSPLERMMLERLRAAGRRDWEARQEVLDAYLEAHPEDPFALQVKANQAFHQGRMELAERLNRRLLEVSPNWVVAYNQLGYIAMRRGRFAEAEEHFTAYRFIAPDQANPHDSLGELFLVLGRYDRAEASFERALEIKPDFWNSLMHVALLRAVQGDVEGLEGVAARARRVDAPPWVADTLDCLATFHRLQLRAAWEEILEAAAPDCLKGPQGEWIAAIVHRAACHLSRFDVARRLEEGYPGAKSSPKRAAAETEPSPMVLHLRGVRAAFAGRLEEAARLLRSADSELAYVDAGVSFFKLGTRLFLVEVLRGLDRDDEAARVLAEVRTVNPALVADFEARGPSLPHS